MWESFGVELIKQGPVFFLLALVLSGVGYAAHKAFKWWSEKSAKALERWLNQVDRSQNQVDSLIQENREDRIVYLESMAKLNERMDNRERLMSMRLDKQDESLSRIERKVENAN